MTRRERDELQKALRLLMDEEGGGYSEGLAIVARLVGFDYPAARAMRGGKALDIRKLASAPNQTFRVRDDKRRASNTEVSADGEADRG